MRGRDLRLSNPLRRRSYKPITARISVSLSTSQSLCHARDASQSANCQRLSTGWREQPAHSRRGCEQAMLLDPSFAQGRLPPPHEGWRQTHSHLGTFAAATACTLAVLASALHADSEVLLASTAPPPRAAEAPSFSLESATTIQNRLAVTV